MCDTEATRKRNQRRFLLGAVETALRPTNYRRTPEFSGRLAAPAGFARHYGRIRVNFLGSDSRFVVGSMEGGVMIRIQKSEY